MAQSLLLAADKQLVLTFEGVTTTYNRIKITRVVIDPIDRKIELICRYGRLVGGVWESAPFPAERKLIIDQPDEYDWQLNEPIPDTAVPHFTTLVTEKMTGHATLLNALTTAANWGAGHTLTNANANLLTNVRDGVANMRSVFADVNRKIYQWLQDNGQFDGSPED